MTGKVRGKRALRMKVSEEEKMEQRRVDTEKFLEENEWGQEGVDSFLEEVDAVVKEDYGMSGPVRTRDLEEFSGGEYTVEEHGLYTIESETPDEQEEMYGGGKSGRGGGERKK